MPNKNPHSHQRGNMADEFSAYQFALDEAAIVAITDQKGIITHANDNFCAISKFTREELIGQDHRIINSGYHEKSFIRNLWTTIANGKIWKGDLCNKAKDGSTYWVSTTIVPFLDKNGKPYQYLAIRADITSRKETEKKLEASIKKTLAYEYALDESAIVAITDQKGTITHVNENFCAISKFTREELIGQDHRIINSGYHDKTFIRDLWYTIANGKIWKGDLCNKAKDGSIYWVSTTIVPFLDKNGKPYQYLAIRADITSRKETEKMLEASVIKTRAYEYALDESAIVAITDQKGIIKHVNDNFCQISKYSRKELLGQDHRIINSGYHEKPFIKNLWTTIAHGKIWKGELCNKAKDGSIYWVSTTIVPFLDKNGKPYQYMAIRADITSRKATEKRLEESIKMTRAYEYALDESAIVAITNQKGIITHVNDNFCEISKYSREELLGQDHRIVNSGLHSAAFIRTLWRTISKGEVWRGELCNLAKDGSRYWVSTTIVPFLNAKGKPYQYLAIRADITARKYAEEKLIKVNRLYSFLSSINQSIIRISNPQDLLDNACKIAVEIGKFKIAWAGLFDDKGILQILSATGNRAVIKKIMFYSGKNFAKGELRESLTGKALRTKKYSVSNNIAEEPSLEPWRETYAELGIASNISLPIKRGENVIGMFHVVSEQIGYFDSEEIALLVESVGDLSYAFENYARKEQQKWDELERRRLHEIHRLLANNTNDIVAIREPSGEFNYVSPSCKAVLGYRPEELLGINPLSLVHPDEQSLIKKAYTDRSLNPELSTAIEMRLLHKNGHYVWLDIRSTPILEDKGTKVVKIQSTLRDITERREGEERLRKSTEFATGVINSLSAHIAVADRTGNIISVNEAWRQYGRENGASDLIRTNEGSNYFEVCKAAIGEGNKTAELALKGMNAVLEGQKSTFYLEYPCHSPTEKMWFGMRVMRFENDESLIVIAHENISSTKRAEQERDRTLQELEKRVMQRTAELNTRNENITDSINYAKRIQVALLHSHSILTELFSKSFIISDPKEIVSGDFFWCHESRTRKFIAVADCTGHGVPGALMSLIGSNLLQQIVVDERIENPSEILELLDQRLLQSLRKNTLDVQDGMDLCLCIYDSHFQELYFTGAMRPLFLSDGKGNIRELHGSRHSIGGDAGGILKNFETQRFSIKPGQRFYLTSDGYYDQFGGREDKKFMKSRFKDTLKTIQHMTMKAQGTELIKIFKKWTGKNERVDDVLVVGVEI
jgi:PAS domain S-box-containing protein